MTIVWVAAVMVLSVALSFVLTLILGFEDIPAGSKNCTLVNRPGEAIEWLARPPIPATAPQIKPLIGLFTSVQFFDPANPMTIVWVAAVMVLSVALSFVHDSHRISGIKKLYAGKQAGRGHRMAGQAANTGYCALSFVLTLILGFEDIPETEPATAAAPAPAAVTERTS
jgi:hypothetical protein